MWSFPDLLDFVILWVIKNDLRWLLFCIFYGMFLSIFPNVFFSVFSHSFSISSSFPTSLVSLNSIAYRRVIRVYQYEVDDDLSGRSFPIFPSSDWPLTPTPHTLWVFFSCTRVWPPPIRLSVCVLFTNTHCNVPWGFFWDEPFQLLNPPSLALAPMLRSVNTSSHSFF